MRQGDSGNPAGKSDLPVILRVAGAPPPSSYNSNYPG